MGSIKRMSVAVVVDGKTVKTVGKDGKVVSKIESWSPEKLKEFQDIVRTNPDNKDVQGILANLIEGKPIFNSPAESKPEKGSSLPVKDKN